MERLKEKLEYFKQVRNEYRGDDVESDYIKGQYYALNLVISHLEPIVYDKQVDKLPNRDSKYHKAVQ